jgi:transposase
MDNCKIHHDDEIREIIENEFRKCARLHPCFRADSSTSDARLVYLPPYSPDFNPIEEMFSFLKAYLRRFEGFVHDDDDLLTLAEEALTSLTEEDVIGWFRDCGYA